MDAPFSLGLDFGSLGYRPAIAHSSGGVRLLPAICERNVSRQRSVVPGPASANWFPGIKNRLGIESATAEDADSAAHAVRMLLTDLHSTVEEQLGQPVERIVIAVPAAYSSARRVKLRDLALAAGFADVHLLNDSMAAAIGYTSPSDSSRILLVYGLNYAGFEAGLVRLADGRYSALGYEGAESPGGAAFDGMLIQACLRAMAADGLWTAEDDLSEDGWGLLRQRVQGLRELVSDRERAALLLDVQRGATHRRLLLTLTRRDFEQAISPLLDTSITAARKLLEEANIAPPAVETILLASRGRHTGLLPRLLAECFGRSPVAAPDDLIARGAALYAASLARAFEDDSESGQDIAAVRFHVSPPFTPQIELHHMSAKGLSDQEGASATSDLPNSNLSDLSDPILLVPLVVHSPDAGKYATTSSSFSESTVDSLETVLEDRDRLFQHAHRLIAAGNHERAQSLLQGLIQEAQVLQAVLHSSVSPSAREAEQAIRNAYDLLRTGQLQEAVAWSHRAYELDAQNSTLFKQIIDIHCQAAACESSMEGYTWAIRWLQCAHSHDPTDPALHERIAERHFLHAQQMADTGDITAAEQALIQCLYFSRNHAGALALLPTLKTP